jgi:two-component system chemotaxis response regulator CheB
LQSAGTSKRIRVLIVDDDALMRAILEAVLEFDRDIEVVGQAANAADAREAIKALNPDVVTLDVMMPDMNGLDFLEKIMRLRPMPVVMVSGLTTAGADATIRALEAGAVECVAKASPGSSNPFEGLAAVVKAASRARVRRRIPTRANASNSQIKRSTRFKHAGQLVAVGSSTGGVEALIEVLSEFPANCPPTVIVQHMPAGFTKSFAARLDRLCAPSVHEAIDGQPIEQGHVYLAPGSIGHLEVVESGGLRCRVRPGEAINNHRPSVDALFNSVCNAAGGAAIGVILTGMGGDGAAGLLAMRKAGARTLGQDQATSVIYGMPKVAFEMGAVEKQLPLTEIGRAILAAAAASSGA